MKKILLFFLTTLLISPLGAFAQARLTGQIDYMPVNPKPYEKVSFTLKSYSFEPDAANVSWYVNKILVKKGVGEKNYSLTLGEANKTYFVGVDVKNPDGSTYQSSIAITPHFTPLLTESVEGYTPPFYEGRSLYSEGAKVKVVAFPVVSEDGMAINKKDLIYKWQVNTIPFTSASGLGKNTFIVRQDELEEENNVDVSVTSKTGQSGLEERVSVKPYDISPLFYLYDPLLGINFNKAYEDTISINKEVKLFYAPYNFAYAPGASYFNWTLNGIPITTDSDFLISLIPNVNTRGQSTLRLTANNNKKQLQSLDSTMTIEYDTTTQ